MTAQLADATKGLLEILTPLTTEERSRVVGAALMLLGDQIPAATSVSGAAANAANNGGSATATPPKSWAAKNGLTQDLLDKFFHFEGDTAAVLELPSNLSSNKEKATATYLLLGLAKHLAKNDSSFSDADARALCTKFGCYDQTNHSKIVGDFGNKITGSKSAGWKLTNPGLAAAAAFVKA